MLSPSTRQTDLKEKLAEYAQADVAEYWIADPDARWIEIHTLQQGRYRKLGRFRLGEQAGSKLLPGCSVSVAELFGVPAEGGELAAKRERQTS